MKTIILLIALVLCNLSFSCEILPNGNYILCDITEIKKSLEQYPYGDKVLIKNEKIILNIKYNIKLAESRLNEAEVKYIESIKKYKTALHNAASNSFIESLIKQKVNDAMAKQKANADIAKQKSNAAIADDIIKQAVYSAEAEQEAYYEITFAEQKAYSEMLVAEDEYENARWECGSIYALAKGESLYLPVGKSPSEIWKLIK